MFTFMKIATFAALAFGTLASAIPAPAPVSVTEAGALIERATSQSTVTEVLIQVGINAAVPCSKLGGLTAKTATPAEVTRLVNEVISIIKAGTAACSKTSGLGSGNILKLLADIIELIITAVNHVFSVCTDKATILAILQLIDDVLATFISTICQLVGGLLSSTIGELVGLLGQLIQLILSLNFTACAKVLLLVKV